MMKAYRKFVSKNLTAAQKQTHVDTYTDWLKNWDVFDKIITGNKMWVFKCDPKMK